MRYPVWTLVPVGVLLTALVLLVASGPATANDSGPGYGPPDASTSISAQLTEGPPYIKDPKKKTGITYPLNKSGNLHSLDQTILVFTLGRAVDSSTVALTSP